MGEELIRSNEPVTGTRLQPMQLITNEVDAVWGGMIAQGRQMLHQGWWILAAPLALLFVTVLAFNMLGEGLRRALDPVMRR